MASQFSYEQIQPLIQSADVWGTQMHCRFRCPVSGATAEASIEMQSLAGKVAGTAVATAKQNVLWSVRSAVTSAIWKSAGSGILGRVASDAAYTAMSQVDVPASGPTFSEKDKREAVVKAFATVAGAFRWDESGQRLIGAGATAGAAAQGEPTTDFLRQLQASPVSERYDQAILARMLLAISAADGQYGQEELDFLRSFVDPGAGSLEDLARRGVPSRVELEEVSQGAVRETMLMVGWAIAMADQQIEHGETARLNEFAAGLSIAEERVGELKRCAQLHILDQELRQAFSDSNFTSERQQMITGLGARIGLDPTDTERAIIQYRKRLGIY
jgi:hypothetical protein